VVKKEHPREIFFFTKRRKEVFDWPVVFLVANVQATEAIIYLSILENLSLISLYIYSMLDKGTKS